MAEPLQSLPTTSLSRSNSEECARSFSESFCKLPMTRLDPPGALLLEFPRSTGAEPGRRSGGASPDIFAPKEHRPRAAKVAFAPAVVWGV